MTVIRSISFDPINDDDGEGIVNGRIILSNGEVRTMSGSVPDDSNASEAMAQRALLRRLVDGFLKG